jgi:hypothetical protein
VRAALEMARICFRRNGGILAASRKWFGQLKTEEQMRRQRAIEGITLFICKVGRLQLIS